jgi:ATP-dependent protease HslVU (ClpYQ) peptidase subunit
VTTIATDGKSMAGDGLVTGNGLKHSMACRKVFRLADGRIAGFCGSSYNVPPFLAWLEHGGDKPDISDDFEALVIHHDGRCLSYNSKAVGIEQEVPAVAGSGGAVALGAMLAGASPGQAVAIAAQRDMCTGGTVFIEALAAR